MARTNTARNAKESSKGEQTMEPDSEVYRVSYARRRFTIGRVSQGTPWTELQDRVFVNIEKTVDGKQETERVNVGDYVQIQTSDDEKAFASVCEIRTDTTTKQEYVLIAWFYEIKGELYLSNHYQVMSVSVIHGVVNESNAEDEEAGVAVFNETKICDFYAWLESKKWKFKTRSDNFPNFHPRSLLRWKDVGRTPPYEWIPGEGQCTEHFLEGE